MRYKLKFATLPQSIFLSSEFVKTRLKLIEDVSKLHFISFWPKLAQTTEVIAFRFCIIDFLSYQRLQKRHESDNWPGANGSFDVLAN